MATNYLGEAHLGQAEALLNSVIQRFLLNDKGVPGAIKVSVPKGSTFLCVAPDRYWAYFAVPTVDTSVKEPAYFLFLKEGDSEDLTNYVFVGLCCGSLVFRYQS